MTRLHVETEGLQLFKIQGGIGLSRLHVETVINQGLQLFKIQGGMGLSWLHVETVIKQGLQLFKIEGGIGLVPLCARLFVKVSRVGWCLSHLPVSVQSRRWLLFFSFLFFSFFSF